MKDIIYFDTEFTGLHKGTTLISIGLVSECGKSFYAEFTDYDKSQIDYWLEQNVINKLLFTDKITASCGSWENWISEKRNFGDGLSSVLSDDKNMSNFVCIGNKEMIRNRLEKWLSQFKDIEIWSDCLAYDWVLFCDIWGHAMNIPNNIRYIPMDIATLLHLKGFHFDKSREEYIGEIKVDEINKKVIDNTIKENTTEINMKHNALFDAYVIRECYKKLVGIKP